MFLEYLEAQILKISLFGANHDDAIVGSMCDWSAQKNSGYVTYDWGKNQQML